MKVGVIVNGSGPLYTDAALALGQQFDDCVIVGQEIIGSELDSCDLYIVIGNYFVNYNVHRAGPAKKYVYDSGKPFIVVTGSLFYVKQPNHV